MGSRTAAWLLTGPVGVFVAGAMDWSVLLARVVRARARGEDPFA